MDEDGLPLADRGRDHREPGAFEHVLLTRTLAIVIAGLAASIACVAQGPPATPTSSVAPVPGTAGGAQTAPTSTGGMSWSRIPDIPTPRSEVAAVLHQGLIYVIGGFGGPNVVERYDRAAGRWERMPDLPIGVDHPMAAALNGPKAGVYVMGGNSGGAATARAFRLAPGATAWEEIASMPEPRAAAAAVTRLSSRPNDLISPQIIVIAGAAGGRLATSTLIYDSLLDRWIQRADIPTPRDHLAAVWLGDRACAVGGRTLSMSRNLAALECYEPYADAWERLPAAPTARGGVGAAVADQRLFFIGGEQPGGTFKEVEIYDPATRTWSSGPDLPTPRHGMGVVGTGDQIFVLTGGPTPGGSQTAACEVLTLTR